MRTFVREKKIYCGHDYLEVDLFNYSVSEKERDRSGQRSKKIIESTPKQIDWNDYNARRRFTQLVNTNFGEGDFHITLTYKPENLPDTTDEAERILKNYLRRVSYLRNKQGLSPLKYISIPSCTFKSDGVTPARIHHHIIMNGGLERDTIEDLWRKRRERKHPKGEKIGYVNADRLQPEESGLAALCEYLAKQTGGKKRWSSSQNLDKPETVNLDPDTPRKIDKSRYSASTNLMRPWSRTNDHSFSHKEIKKIVNAPLDPEYWEKRYPGYTLINGEYGYKAVHSDSRGWAIYIKLRRKKE